MRYVSILAVMILLACGRASPAASEASPVGFWWTEKKSAIVEIYRCSSAEAMLCGKITWFRVKADDPNPRGLDLKNPDPAKRGRPVCGLTFMTGFRPSASPNEWEGGGIYDAESGNTYHGTLKLQADGALSVHGYIGIPLFGASETWTRDTQPVPHCPSQ